MKVGAETPEARWNPPTRGQSPLPGVNPLYPGSTPLPGVNPPYPGPHPRTRLPARPLPWRRRATARRRTDAPWRCRHRGAGGRGRAKVPLPGTGERRSPAACAALSPAPVTRFLPRSERKGPAWRCRHQRGSFLKAHFPASQRRAPGPERTRAACGGVFSLLTGRPPLLKRLFTLPSVIASRPH